MHHRRFAVGLAGIVAVLASSWAATPAQAVSGQDVASCKVAGDASTAPSVPFDAPVPAGGAYNFNPNPPAGDPTGFLTLTCQVTDATDQTETDTGVIIDGTGSGGAYVSDVCGTGSADGNAPINVVHGDANTVSELNGGTIYYHIDFVAGAGSLTVTGITFPAGSDNLGQQAIGKGPVTITADQTPNPLTNFCTSSFAVNGSIQFTAPDNLES
jgi:hypothetical protein